MINLLRKLFNLKKVGGVEKVFINLCKAFDELKIDYVKNPPFKKILPGEAVIILGNGKYALQGYDKPNPIIAGIGLMTHPAEWPNLFKEYPVAKYLQHSTWTNNIYIPYYGVGRCEIWPAGIDTKKWAPDNRSQKTFDFLIYNKIMWNQDDVYTSLKDPIIDQLEQLGLSYKEIVYGKYKEGEYFGLLQQCNAMIFLCEHESQGFACCEALSMNVPVFAWDQGYWLDPNRFKWNAPQVPATSIPYFDDRCGSSFTNFKDFENRISYFWDKVKTNSFNPRAYILENLTLKKSAERMLEIVNSIYP
jgi:hypothetical protein